MSPGKLLERIAQLVPVLLGVSVIVFVMMALTPGDPVQIMIGDQSITPEQEAELRRGLGLDRPMIERFFIFLGNALQFDFGESFYHRRPVADVIAERLPATIELSLVALIVALVTAIPLGVLAAIRKNSIFDRLATVGSLLGVSLPGFWFGILLLMLFAVHLQILPVSGRIGFESEVPTVTGFLLIDTLLAGDLRAFGDAMAHLILPAITLGLPMTAILMRVTRSSMLEVLRQDYVTFADAKGLSRRRVLFRHALKNALVP
ncbi:peptide/nickel transport system permease protein, partial [Salipiger thiooxidans]